MSFSAIYCKNTINKKVFKAQTEEEQEDIIHFKQEKTVHEFMNCTAEVRGIMGAMGSGKSSACCVELLRLASIQPKSRDGKRYSRWAIIRDTLENIKKTTLKTFLTWGGHMGEYKKGEKTFIIKTDDLDVEIYFIPLDIAKDMSRLLSFEITGAYINEAKTIKEDFVTLLCDRVGRYSRPDIEEGEDRASYLIMDTNPPTINHWWYRRFELRENVGADNWKIFKQPSGRSAEAENLDNLKHGYYKRMEENHDEAYCRVNADGEYGFTSSGQPVYPTFSRNKHVLDYSFYDKDKDFYFNYTRDYGYLFEECIVGCDGGLDCTSIYMARCLRTGTLLIFDEIYLDKSIEERSCDLMAKYMTTKEEQLRQKYGFEKFTYYLDPSCKNRVPTNAGSVLKLYKSYGFNAMSAGTNDPTKRREGIYKLLSKNLLKITRNCEWVINGMDGGYRYKDQNRYEETTTQVVKDEYSHVIEGLEYGVLGLRIFENENLGHNTRNLSKQNNNFMKSLSNLYKANQENEQKELKKIKYLSKHEEFVENLKNSFKTNDFY